VEAQIIESIVQAQYHTILPPKTNGQNFKGELKYENP